MIGVVATFSGLALLVSLWLPWFELRLYTWQGGPGPDIDNPFIALTPWSGGRAAEHPLPGGAIYFAIAVVALVALVAVIRQAKNHQDGFAVLAGSGVAACALIAIAAILALNPDVPFSYGQDVVRVETVPMWGLAPAVLSALTLTVVGLTGRLAAERQASGVGR